MTAPRSDARPLRRALLAIGSCLPRLRGREGLVRPGMTDAALTLLVLFSFAAGASPATGRSLGANAAFPIWSDANPLGSRQHPEEAPAPGPIRRAPDAEAWPDDYELGLQAARAYAFHFGLVEDDSLLSRINRIGYAVTSQVGRPDLLFTFHVLDVPDANAFALPGGFIFITKGMTDLHLPDDALANLLGHEAAHVAGNHFSRAGRISTALSLLQTAVTVAAILAAPSSTSGGYDRDPDTGEVRASLAGKEAAIQGTNIFGGVFRELLVRGYGRGLEFEADERGRRYAGRAGYAPTGSVALLEGLHRHIYEDQEYGYWRTHPYFDDRVLRARAASSEGSSPPDSAEITRYRSSVAERLSALARSILDEPTALFVHRAALRAAPKGESAAAVEHALLRLRAQRLRSQKPILRAYGPLVADYDSLLARFGGLAEGRAERDSLDRERHELRPTFTEILARPDAGTPFLELFLDNYPDDPEAPGFRFRLAERYRLADRPDEAALALADLDDPDWAARRRDALRLVLPQTKELTTSQRVLAAAGGPGPDGGGTELDSAGDDSLAIWALNRLEAQAAGLDSLEVGSRFLQRYPQSPVATKVVASMEALAMKRYYAARLCEGMQDRQAALDGYNELILLAPATRAAGLAREGIARVQTTAGTE